jgi:hypothetical protein
MKNLGLEPAYEASRAWAVHPVGRTPPGWAETRAQWDRHLDAREASTDATPVA